jgi:hypothetical protein
MRKLIYTLLKLARESKKTCDFCSNPYGKDNKSAFRIVIRVKSNNEWLSDDVVCENCKDKFESDELTKCERCGRLQTKLDIDFSSGKYLCDCIRYNEDLEEKKLPSVPYKSQAAFYERQINNLQEKKTAVEEALAIEREEVVKFQEKSEEWSKRQKQELLDKIANLEEKKIRSWEAQNKKLKEQNGIVNYEKKIAELKKQLY